MPVSALNLAFLVSLVALVSSLSGQDRPLRVIMEPPARFPEVIGRDDSPPGSVTLVIGVSPTGEYLDALVLAYTHIEYAREARRAAEFWTYRPATVGGKPVGAIEEFVIKVEADRMVRRLAPVNTNDRLFERTIPKKVIQVFVGQRELDSPLALVAAPPPPSVTIPEDMEVTIDFYVDQEGKPRLPTIRAMDDPGLARLVLQTIQEWRFTPPTRHGKPVITRARQQFVFHGKAAEEKKEAGTAAEAGRR